MRRLPGVLSTCLLISAVLPTLALAEGTAQLGANQDLTEFTVISVDVLKAGEVINIAVGNDSATSTAAVEVTVKDPNGKAVSGSPFTVKPGTNGFLATPDKLPPETISKPLQVVTTVKGVYTVTFDNKNPALGTGYEQYVDPFDITVTPTAATPVKPKSPPGGVGRIHTKRWSINAHTFTTAGKSDASFYVLAPTGSNSDTTWLLQFNGLAGFFFDVSGNDIGLPSPNSGFSESETKTFGPLPKYEIYLNVPEVAKGGGKKPVLTNFAFKGVSAACKCAISSLEAEFSFDSNVDGTYHLVIDVDKDGLYDPAKGDVQLVGLAKTGTNTFKWKGLDNNSKAVAKGSYTARLSLRVGEFHFTGRDIETSNPGLRIFNVDPPKPGTTPTGVKMFWNDARVNTATYKIDPGSTLPNGLSSGKFADQAVCSKPLSSGVNAHCWGNFDNNPATSPGEAAYIDTWVFAQETSVITSVCVDDGASDQDNDGLTLQQECGTYKTDPTKDDTDGDGLKDGTEVGGPNKTDPLKADTDGDGLSDGIEDANKNGKKDAGETDPNNKDTDGDGLSDGVEDANKDGKYDKNTETDPLNDDTDGDGIKDGVEDTDKDGTVDPGETDPKKADTDGDGLKDGEEDKDKDGKLDVGETDPTKADTDGDGLTDGIEMGVDKDGNAITNANKTDPTKKDTDGDGLTDSEEDANKNGILDIGEPDPNKKDTDSDGLTDGIERGVSHDGTPITGATKTDPTKKDTDGDGLTDSDEDKNLNGKKDSGETDPTNKDTDGDGLTDGVELGVDRDGKKIPNANPTKPLNPDSDGDGIKDGVEDKNGNGVVDTDDTDPAKGETDPNKPDTDGDGLNDGWTDKNGNGSWDAGEGEDRNNNGKQDSGETDPRLKDTDGGGEDDGSEVTKTKHDPHDPKDDRAGNTGLFGGGGCAVGAERSAGGGLILIMLALAGLLWIRQRGWLQRPGAARVGTLALGALLLASAPARAADPVTLPVLNFQPAASTINYFQTEGGLVLPHLSPSVHLLMNYAHRPLEMRNTDSDSVLSEVVRYQVNADLCIAMGFFDRLELGIALPVTLVQESGDLGRLDRDAGSAIIGGLGDIRIVPKLRIHTKGSATLGLSLPLSVPSGSQENFLGNDNVTFAPRFIFAIDTEYFSLALNAGYRLRFDQSVNFSATQTLTVDDEVIGSLGMKVAVWKGRVDLIADSFVSMSIWEQDEEEIPVEVLGGVRVTFPYGIIANVGGGAGVTRGYGAPRFRVFWGVGYQYVKEKEVPKPVDDDWDKDGILNAVDKCPRDPEDKDNFEDADGCPELDNDKDGINDTEDKCPLEPEDKDGIDDADGCPDNDNDKDGILDNVDKCPLEPEDKDGFEDADGCPELDNDKDGILDQQDRCPNDPEDKDNFEDADGCPDPDNDKDGILDKDDKCPLQPEVFNGVKDDDGCPDKSRGPVKIQRGKITVPPVYFATGKDVILERSFPVLRLVADTLKKNKWVKKVRIEGHTDNRGNDNYNLQLSKRRAASVMRFLLGEGVESARLASEGYGEAQPIASNRSRRGRAKNRRVEFVILDPAQSQKP